MKRFLIKILSRIFVLAIFIFIISFQNKNKIEIIDKYFDIKINDFESFIAHRNHVNLVLGSSISEKIQSHEIGENWTSFTSGQQNIYESFIFLKEYLKKVKVDTVVVEISPFSFPKSYNMNRENAKPYLNGNFFIIDNDSITSIYIKGQIQKLKDKFFPKISNYMNDTKEDRLRENFKKKIPVDFKKLININTNQVEGLPSIHPYVVGNHKQYFYNVKSPPNMLYFELFNSLISNNEITAIYFIPPKSAYYLQGCNENGFDKIWEQIISGLNEKEINLLNFEKINLNSNNNMFSDESHLTDQGGLIITKAINNYIESLKTIY